MSQVKAIYQLKISLKGAKPPIWRTLQVPSSFTFWDLHCAIQDAFAWDHSHLHSFEYRGDTYFDLVFFGVPMDDDFDFMPKTLPGWQYKIDKYLHPLRPKMLYTYDFGDDWHHEIKLEHVLPVEKGVAYPRCIKGRRNAPPDDCGGIWSYMNMLDILDDPDCEEYEETREWIESLNDGPFDPAKFDPKAVQFEDPQQVFEIFFGDE